MLRFPLELPPQAKPRRSHWRAFWGFLVMVALVLFLVYGALDNRATELEKPLNRIGKCNP